MVLKIETKAEVLKQYLEVINILHEEGIVKFTPEGVDCSVVDPSHVAMVDAHLDKEAFDSYDTSDISLGINFDKIQDFMKIIKSTDPLEMEFDEEENLLILRSSNITRTMPLIDVSGMQETKLPQLTHIAEVVVKTAELEKGIKAAERVTEQIKFQLTGEEFQLTGKSDREKVNLKIPRDRLEKCEMEEGEVKSTYSLEFLSKMIKVASTAETVTLKLNNNYPLQIEFDILGGNGRVIYLLAPRMDD